MTRGLEDPESLGLQYQTALAANTPAQLPNGEKRTFLKDGKNVLMRGWAGNKPGALRIGFGECVGTVLPACPIA